MTKKYECYDKIMCRIKIRPTFQGRKAKPKVQELNGIVLLMQVLWEEDDEDKYPGEYALKPYDKDTWFKWSEENEVGWIASGDVEILESCHAEGKPNFVELSSKHFMIVNKKDGHKAFGLQIKDLVNCGIETVVINRDNFITYNKLLNFEEVMQVVEGVDYLDSQRIRWGSKGQYSEIADEY